MAGWSQSARDAALEARRAKTARIERARLRREMAAAALMLAQEQLETPVADTQSEGS